MFEEEIKVETLPFKNYDNKTFIILQANPNTYTHGFFKYPCRFIPEIPRWAIKNFTKENDIVFDPFAGSGTSLLEALIENRASFGTEIDDIAKLIIEAKNLIFTDMEFDNMQKLYFELNLYVADKNSTEHIPSMNNLNHWFSAKNIHILGKISSFIDGIANQDFQKFFKVCFASIIKKCSYCDDQSPKPYVSTKIKKKEYDALNEFNSVFNKYFLMLKDFNKLNIKSKIKILNGDALNFELGNISLAVTSPPYINAFDYARTMRLENLWLGTKSEEKLKESKKSYVGTEVIEINKENEDISILKDSNVLSECFYKIYAIDKKRALVVKKFFDDMKTNLLTVFRQMKKNGHYVIVIGNSNIRKIEIQSWQILKDIALKIGFKFDSVFRYLIKNPYIRIPRNGRGGLIKYDYVLNLCKGE